LHQSSDSQALLHFLPRDTFGFWVAEDTARRGKIPGITAFIKQCKKLPKLRPLALTRLGNTSLINTQMNAPWFLAKRQKKSDVADQHPDQEILVAL
jgi:hypothetical protein